MSQAFKDSKPRATKNSQRLYNLEEQEKLYKNLGITQMANNSKNSDSLENHEEETLSDCSGDEAADSPGEEAAASGETKKQKRLSKESHIMSDSDLDQEQGLDKKQDPDSEKKQKKKRKAKAQEVNQSPKVGKGKKAKLQGGDSQKKGKKSPSSSKAKGKKSSVNMSKPAIKLPDDLLTSPEDSSVIAAHMNAYTKWLLENNMLVSQQSLNQFSLPNQGVTTPSQNISNPGTSAGPGTWSQTTQNLKIQHNNGGAKNRPDHDISTDESSNVDNSEMEGQAPYIPVSSSTQNQIKSLTNQPQLPQAQDNGELFNVCEAEKDVPLEEDSSVGPAVSEQMALMIKNFLGRNKKTAKIEDLLQEFIRPKNMPFLKPPFIEEEVYIDLATGARHFDKNCRLLQGYIFAAITALTMSLQALILTEKLHPIITDAGVKVKKALQLLAFSTKEINDRRKDALKSSVNQEYLPLLKHAKPPSDDWLLGGELHEAIKKCDDSKKLSEKIMRNRKAQQAQNQPGQNQTFQNQNQNQDRFKYKNKGKKDSRPYYRNYQQGNQQTNTAQYYQNPNPHYVQPVVHQQQNQLQLWQQYQQQLQQAQAQALQNNSLPRQNLGFQQPQQWREQPQQQQPYGHNTYNQKKKN